MRTLTVEVLRHVNGVAGETLEPGDIVTLPEPLARELLRARTVQMPVGEPEPPAGPLVAGANGFIENRAADVESRDPVRTKRTK